MKRHVLPILLLLFASLFAGPAQADPLKDLIFDPGPLPPRDSALAVGLGDPAPDFTLPAINGGSVTLSSFRGQKNVVLSFVPAAFTPVCSGQWPGYRIAKPLFERQDAILLGISTDNLASLYAWVREMGGLWFPVLSDFWPHGAVAAKYGVLRSTGVSERAVFVIDKQGIVRFIDVHDINSRPDLGEIMRALERLR